MAGIGFNRKKPFILLVNKFKQYSGADVYLNDLLTFIGLYLATNTTFYRPMGAAKILANLLIMGSGILGRAVFQAYRQALASIITSLHHASKSGVAQETVQNIRRGSKIMAEPEARQVLGLSEKSSWEEVMKRYEHLFEQNAKNGSFYIQSKVHRAKECLESIYQKNAQGMPDA
ncbi:hypothetical protein ACFE04_028434 [Oxalis oulophora]